MKHLITLERIVDRNYWSQNFGLARTFLALCTLATLCSNPIETLFTEDTSNFYGTEFNLFYIFNDIGLSRLLACIVLIIIASGYFPRWTAIPHFWISSSFSSVSIAIEGGDQIVTIICLLILPVALFDKRRNHFIEREQKKSFYVQCIGFTMFFLIAIQVSFLYFQAGIGKLKVTEWANGTASYYWLNDHVFGANETILSNIGFILKSAFLVTLMTWGSIAIELFLGLNIFFSSRTVRMVAFATGIVFHLIIALNFGLISFLFAMVASLLLYLIPFGNILSRSKKFSRYEI